jgi:hypothetical protein
MGKFRLRANLFALLIVAGAFISGIFEVRGGMDMPVTARSGHATAATATVQTKRAPATAGSGTDFARAETVLARVSH